MTMDFGELIFLVVMVALAGFGKKKKAEKQARRTPPAFSPTPALIESAPPKAPEQKAAPAIAKPAAAPVKLRPAAPAAARVMVKEEKKIEPRVDTSYEDRLAYGSIKMPKDEPHDHEGKPLPCPAEEREMPRAYAGKNAPVANGKLQLSFTKDSLVQAAVMSEVLNRPRFVNGRRVIR